MVDMENLTNLTKKALASPAVLDVIELLKKEIVGTEEPFVWKVLPQRPIGAAFPNGILSGWIFVLKPRTCNPSHLHPNSTQYSAITEGSGKIRIGEEEKEMQIFDPSRMLRAWYVIPKNVPHSVVTRDRPNVVLSFHTCSADQLVEVETSSGRSRFYERH